MSALLTSLVPAVGWALIHFVWQGALIGALTAALLFLLRRARPQARYLVACAGLALCLALPLAAILSSVARLMNEPAQLLIYSAIAFSGGGVELRNPGWTSWLQENMPLLVAGWCFFACLFGLRVAFGLVWVERLGRSGRKLANPRWQARLDEIAKKVGVFRTVDLRVVEGIDTPVVAGCWRPIVLVPAALITGMPVDLLEALLAHELAHVKRFDYLVNLAQSLVEVLLFYHPAVWWLSKQIRLEREQIADDLAAAALGDATCLAHALQRLEIFQSSFQRYAPAANGGNLMQRIKRLVRPDTHALSWKAAVLPAALMLACATYAAPALHDDLAAKAASKTEAAVPASQPISQPISQPVSATPVVAPAIAVPPVAAVTALPVVKKAAAPAPVQLALAEVKPVAPPTAPTPPAPVTSPQPSGDIIQSGWSGGGPIISMPRGRISCEKPTAFQGTEGLAKDVPEGTSTVLNLLIGTDGKIKTALIARSSGVAALDEAARAHYSTCMYTPGSIDGVPAELNTILSHIWKKPATTLDMRQGGTIRAAVIDAKNCKKPVYPAESLSLERMGTVLMTFLIGVDGKVKEGMVKKSSGALDLDTTALEALKQCVFKPGTRDDVAIESWTSMQYVWKLE